MMNAGQGRRPAFVSVVMPTKNAAATVMEQLQALSRQTYSGTWELVISDNGSDDDTLERVRAAAGTPGLPSVRIVRADGQSGPGYARNVGVEHARGDFIAMCDADDVVRPEWLEELVRAAREADLVGGWLNVVPLNDPVVGFWRTSYPRDCLPKKGGFLHYVQAANLGVWKDVFLDVGGFGTDFEAGEDIDFCWRAQLAGYRLEFAPEAEVWYRHRESLVGVWKQFRSYGRADVDLASRFHDHGFEIRRTALLRRAWWLLVRVPYLFVGRRRRGLWLRIAAQLAGTLERGPGLRKVVGI